jgi:deazaflavin-dependent oxidoreductase (nitroreductase family)
MDSRRRARIVRIGEKYSFNRLFRFLVRIGVAPGYAVIETTGRKTGLPRQVPVANGLRGDTFWVIAEQGRHADWVRNIEAEPGVRVRLGRHWRTGRAHLLTGDDWTTRLGSEIPRWNKPFLRALGTNQLTVRIDLDPLAPAARREWNHNIAYHDVVLAWMPDRCGTALDVGCGDGRLVRAIAGHAGLVTGIDTDHASIEQARALGKGCDNVRFIEGDFLTEPFDDSQFDLITAVATLHHMPLDRALTRAKQLLAPGGVLVIVGCARPSGLLDLAYDIAGSVANKVATRRRGYWQHDAPINDPTTSYTEVRRIAGSQLPGHTYRRRLYFRYTITWTRPADAAQQASN